MKKVRSNKKAMVFFLAPALILFIAIIIIPIFMSAYYSLLDWDGMSKGTFVGLQNYIDLFTSKSLGFPRTVKNAMLLAIFSVFIQLPISLGIALVLSKKIKGERFLFRYFLCRYCFPV